MGKKSAGRVRVKQVGPKAPVNPFAELGNIAPEEQIYLPPKPDANVTQIWPMTATFSLDYSRYSAIWPTYIDSNKTVKIGRRISAEDAVPEPTVQDISEALQHMNVKHAIQPYKGYPRDTESRWYNSGRVLVDLEEAVGAISDGAYDADTVPDVEGVVGGGRSKKALLREIARRIPTLPGRLARLEAKKNAEEEEKRKERERAAAAKTSSGGTGGAASKGKKKGKKKR